MFSLVKTSSGDIKEGEEATEGEEVVVKGAERNIYIGVLVGMKEDVYKPGNSFL